MTSIGTIGGGGEWLRSMGVTERAGKNCLHKETPVHKRARLRDGESKTQT